MVHLYKLTYFNVRGVAEPIRLIFAFADVGFDDHRIDRADWPALKPNTPFGQLPILDIDNGKVVLAQSKAIARYLGNEFGLVPKDQVDAAKADMLVDGLADLRTKFSALHREQDPEKKKELRQTIEAQEVPPYLKRCEATLANVGTGYFVTNKVTWADIFLFNSLHDYYNKSPKLFEGFEKVVGFVNKMASESKIKEYLDKRPNTEF